MSVSRLTAFFAIILLVACTATAPQAAAPQKGIVAPQATPLATGELLEKDDNEPAWRATLKIHEYDPQSGTHYFYGAATTPDKEESRTKAVANAIAYVSKQMSVRVKYGTNLYQEQLLGADAGYLKDVTIERGAEVTLKNYEPEIYSERWKRYGASTYDSWARLAVTAAEWQRLAVEALSLAAWRIDPGTCTAIDPGAIRASLTSYATRKLGLKLSPAPTTADLETLAQKPATSRFLSARLSCSKRGDLFVSAVSVEMYDLFEQALIHSAIAEGVSDADWRGALLQAETALAPFKPAAP
ncbi:MAG TPA: hypothetical protein P5077_00390 [bacterium]|nr:hypothetical protein [bacterium]